MPVKTVISLSTCQSTDDGHRVHGLDDLLVGHRPRAAFAEHRGRQRREPFLACRIERGAGREQDAEDDERRRAGLKHAGASVSTERLQQRGRSRARMTMRLDHQFVPAFVVSVTIVRLFSVKYSAATSRMSCGVTCW